MRCVQPACNALLGPYPWNATISRPIRRDLNIGEHAFDLAKTALKGYSGVIAMRVAGDEIRSWGLPVTQPNASSDIVMLRDSALAHQLIDWLDLLFRSPNAELTGADAIKAYLSRILASLRERRRGLKLRDQTESTVRAEPKVRVRAPHTAKASHTLHAALAGAAERASLIMLDYVRFNVRMC